MRCYVCPEHPEKVYTSWRKFRGHWSTQHRGEECPPREEFLQEMEKDEIIEKKGEHKEDLKKTAAAKEAAAEEIATGEFVLPEEPGPKLAKILEVHGVPAELSTQILGVFQLHPGYRENPVNLHYLLTAKLPRRFHSSIPMMISAFATTEENYPSGMPLGMMPGGMGQGIMPPFMQGGGYPPYYPPTFGYQPIYRPPIGGREPVEEEGRRPRVREPNPVQDAVALLETMLSLKDKLMPSGGGESTSVQEIFEGFRSTIEEVTKNSTEQQDKLIAQMEKVQESNKATLEIIKENLHKAEKDRLQDKIEVLQESKDEERSEGLGQLLKEAGEGMGTQVEGLRTSVTQGFDKVGDLVGKIVTVEGSKFSGTGGTKAPTKEKSIATATELLEAEAAVDRIAQEL